MLISRLERGFLIATLVMIPIALVAWGLSYEDVSRDFLGLDFISNLWRSSRGAQESVELQLRDVGKLAGLHLKAIAEVKNLQAFEERHGDERIDPKCRGKENCRPLPFPSGLPQGPEASPVLTAAAANEREVSQKLGDSYSTAYVAKIRDALASGAIAYNPPKSIPLKLATSFVLVLNPKADLTAIHEELLREIKALGTAPPGFETDSIGKVVKIANSMTAELRGSPTDFEITPSDPVSRAVASDTTTKWLWTVRAKTPGVHVITLTLSANVVLQGNTTPLVVETYSHPITVRVGVWEDAKGFLTEAKEPIGGLTAICGAGWAVFRWLRRRKAVGVWPFGRRVSKQRKKEPGEDREE